jgi:hypothetical protein
MTESSCFVAVLMWPPTLPSMCALSLTCLPLPYPSSQSQLSASGTKGTSMTTGQQPVLPHLTTPNCKLLWMDFVKHTMLVWRTYIRYMSSLTPQIRSASPWPHLITWDNACPSPFVRCWWLGSDTIQITLSTSTTSLMVLTSMAVLYTTEPLIQHI